MFRKKKLINSLLMKRVRVPFISGYCMPTLGWAEGGPGPQKMDEQEKFQSGRGDPGREGVSV